MGRYGTGGVAPLNLHPSCDFTRHTKRPPSRTARAPPRPQRARTGACRAPPHRTLVATRLYRVSRRIAVYLPNDGEIDPVPLWRASEVEQDLLSADPVARSQHDRLWFAPFTQNTPLAANRFGILEPVASPALVRTGAGPHPDAARGIRHTATALAWAAASTTRASPFCVTALFGASRTLSAWHTTSSA